MFKRLGQFINRHKTKAVGFLLTVVGTLQAFQPQVQQLVSPTTFAKFVIGVGVLVSILGFINTALQNRQQ